MAVRLSISAGDSSKSKTFRFSAMRCLETRQFHVSSTCLHVPENESSGMAETCQALWLAGINNLIIETVIILIVIVMIY